MYYKNSEGELVAEEEDQVDPQGEAEVLVEKPKPVKRNSPRKRQNFKTPRVLRGC